jgi:RHS repeat-associated protein
MLNLFTRHDTTYTYDAVSRLASLAYSLDGNSLGDFVYSYDSLGRMVQTNGSFASTFVPQPVTSNAYDLANQLNVSGQTSYSYDANGNLLTDGTNTYTWDARNHLASISGANAASFVYDAFGRRISKTINGVTTQYNYDGDNPIQEIQNGTLTANMLAGGADQFYLRSDPSGSWTYLTDVHGSTIALADSSGTIQTQYTYDPFGNVEATGATSSNSYQYTGRENDGTGLYYYRARYYSPTLARFISKDPAVPLSPTYIYAGDSPIMFSDPSGAVTILTSSLIQEVQNVIYNETSILNAGQPGILSGRTDLGIALYNGSWNNKNLCSPLYVTAKFGCTEQPNENAAVRAEAAEASLYALTDILSGFDLLGAEYYAVSPTVNPGPIRPGTNADPEYLVVHAGPFHSSYLSPLYYISIYATFPFASENLFGPLTIGTDLSD